MFSEKSISLVQIFGLCRKARISATSQLTFTKVFKRKICILNFRKVVIIMKRAFALAQLKLIL